MRLFKRVTTIFFALCVLSSPAVAQTNTEASWGPFLEAVVQALAFSSDTEPPIVPTPPPSQPPYSIPLPKPGLNDPKIIEEIIKKFRQWPWKRIIEKYDLDGDGTLSPNELKKFLQDRYPCDGIIVQCDRRDAIIDELLCQLLDRGALCDIQNIELSPELIKDWLDRWINYVEWEVNQCNSEVNPSEDRKKECEKLKKLLEELKKLRELFLKGSDLVTSAPSKNGVSGADW